jgi:Na+-transporting NADH:ubiquinone oxidoreductase subunit NqrC
VLITVAPLPNIRSPITSLPAVLPKPQLPSGIEPDIVTTALDAQTSNDSPSKITAIIVVVIINCLVVIAGVFVLWKKREKGESEVLKQRDLETPMMQPRHDATKAFRDADKAKLKVIDGTTNQNIAGDEDETIKDEEAAKAAAASRTIIRDDAARAIMENADAAQKVHTSTLKGSILGK